ncbi:MAG: C40 family peptidase [Treponemataceae bacterium]|nr:C40 family peptidase [Treponemataceae bacterium]
MTVAQKRLAVIEECKKYIGTPYVLGGESKNGIDCSGLVMITARDIAGVMLPRKASEIYSYVRVISETQRQPGDLVFFSTVNKGQVSHVGVYIGKGQFIHAVSDGPNTGVIVSSLEQGYWKQRYVGTGSYFPSGYNELAEGKSKKKSQSDKKSFVKVTTQTNQLMEEAKNRFPIDMDLSALFNWNFFTSNSFMFNARGFSIQVHGQYNRTILRPGIGIGCRDEIKMGVVQIPLIISISPQDFVRIYAGPVFTIGTPYQIGSSKEIKASIFPGIIGMSFQTPAIQFGDKVGLRFVQDISYEVFNETNNSALGFVDSLAAGFAFQSGVRIDIYSPKLKKKQNQQKAGQQVNSQQINPQKENSQQAQSKTENLTSENEIISSDNQQESRTE